MYDFHQTVAFKLKYLEFFEEITKPSIFIFDNEAQFLGIGDYYFDTDMPCVVMYYTGLGIDGNYYQNVISVHNPQRVWFFNMTPLEFVDYEHALTVKNTDSEFQKRAMHRFIGSNLRLTS